MAWGRGMAHLEADQGSAGILIVERDGAEAERLGHSVRRIGYGVTAVVTSADDAVRSIEQFPPQLMLINVALGPGFTGIDTAARVHRDFSIPVVFVAESAHPELLGRAQGAEPYGYLIKPLTDDTLTAGISVALCRHAAERRHERAAILRKANVLQDALIHAQDSVLTRAGRHELFDGLLQGLLRLTDSQYGYIGETFAYDDGEAYQESRAISNIAWNEESHRYYEENWYDGLRFDCTTGLPGAVVTSGEPVIANDAASDPRSAGLPAGHPAIRTFLGLPIFFGGNLIGTCGLANRPGGYDRATVDFLQPYLTTCGSVLSAYRAEQERKKSEAALHEMHERLKSSFDTELVAWAISRQSDGVYLEANPGFLKITGYSREELIGRSSVELGFFSDVQRKQMLTHLEDAKRLQNEEMTFQTKSGDIRTILFSIGSITIAGEPCLLATMVDISDRKSAEQQVQESLKEKEVLLREIHHRVKNNLAVIASLLTLQASHCGGELDGDAIQDLHQRIRSMALAHKRLYESKNLAALDARDYLGALADDLMAAYGNALAHITMEKDIQDVPMNLDTAVPVGLLLTELVSNSLKHAFPDQSEGLVRMSLKSEGHGRFVLIVADNGIGMPTDIDWDNPPSMGLDLVDTFVRQLHGSFHVTAQGGTLVCVRFSEKQ